MRTAKSYMQNMALPFVNKLKELLISILKRYYLLEERFRNVSLQNQKLMKENDSLMYSTDRLFDENRALRMAVKDFSLLKKVFGDQQIDEMIQGARSARTHRRRHERTR